MYWQKFSNALACSKVNSKENAPNELGKEISKQNVEVGASSLLATCSKI